MKRIAALLTAVPALWIIAAPAGAGLPAGFHWRYFPMAEQLNTVYPQIAADNEVEGAATLLCTIVGADGRVSCVVVSEMPEMCGNQLDRQHPTRTLLGRITGYPELKDANGNPVPVRCEFGKAAVKAVETWGRADMSDGVAVGAMAQMTIRFQLG